MSYEMNELLELVVEQNASDLHLQVGQPPTLRLSGTMTPIDGPPLSPLDTEKLMQSITPDSHISNVKLNGGSDFGFAFGDKARFRVIDFSSAASTATGFLRSLNRQLGLPMRAHAADLFDQAQRHLTGLEQEQGPHPLLIIDDAEGLSGTVLDLVRRMTCYDLDAEDRFSILLSGTDDLLGTLRRPELASLRSR